MSTQDYDELAEFHDLFMVDPWRRLAHPLVEAFGGLGADDLVVDVGAGTGVGTRALSRASPAQVLAIEPSRTMRTVLLARIADDPDMVRRVSVVAGTVPAALDEVPRTISGFVCAHVLGHLTGPQRIESLRALGQRLRDGGTGLLTHHDESEEVGRDEPVEEEVEVGRHRYRARYEGTTGATVTYEVLDGDRVVRRSTVSSVWDPPSTSELLEELTAAGLVVIRRDDGVVLVGKR